MVFASITFLYYFLPGVLFLYFLVPKYLKNLVLLLASLFFYGWGEPKYVFFMIASIMSGYISGLLIEVFYNTNKKKQARLVLWGAVVIQLGVLGYFKYVDFFVENFNTITGLSLPLLKVALPMGISFYTFQIISYIVDVYRRQVSPQRNFISLAMYIAMFPQLVAGPIVRYQDIERYLAERNGSWQGVALGIRRFIFGLSKKVLIANTLGELCEIFRGSNDKSVLFFWLYGISFTLQIYFDFSGYSEMAIGLGKILGFQFPENFNYPYISKSVTEFWRRWHMSLGAWFRDYVYIPLGGNRVSKGRWFLNILVVWMLTGFWHGAAWNFILWGLLFSILLIIEKIWLLNVLKKSKVIAHIYLINVVVISFVIFNATDVKEAFGYIGGMFGVGEFPLVSKEFEYYLKSYTIVLIIGLVGATPLSKWLADSIRKRENLKKGMNVIEPFLLVALMMGVTAYLVGGSFHPFLYFRF
ncbi:MAG: MBOAT family protein [Lachnospiraceae bacterium]|nr:MBOAT family protein [Lachnospiraceae bacterium]